MTRRRTSASKGANSPEVTGFYHEPTGSIQYVAACPTTQKAALIDVVQDYDPKSAATGLTPAQDILDFVASQGLDVQWVLDTHPHADHAMASDWLRGETGAPNGIGAKVAEIAKLWTRLYHAPGVFDVERDFDHLWEDGATFQVGDLPVRVMLSPGHTLGSVTYVVGEDAAFVHDTLMQPDVGTSRADFPGGSAEELWDSIQAIFALDDTTRLFVGHDYGTDTREAPEWESTVAAQKLGNPHVGGDATKEAFVKRRTERDATLPLPDRMLAVLQMNLRAGKLPDAESDGHRYLKVPLNRF